MFKKLFFCDFLKNAFVNVGPEPKVHHLGSSFYVVFIGVVRCRHWAVCVVKIRQRLIWWRHFWAKIFSKSENLKKIYLFTNVNWRSILVIFRIVDFAIPKNQKALNLSLIDISKHFFVESLKICSSFKFNFYLRTISLWAKIQVVSTEVWIVNSASKMLEEACTNLVILSVMRAQKTYLFNI